MTSNLDPVAVSVTVVGVVFSPALAAVVGPYAVIVLSSAIGAAWALGRREPSTRFNAVNFFALICGTALMVTVNVADMIGMWLGKEDTRWLLSPVALFIGGVGQDWIRLGKWVWGQFLSFKRGGAQ
ncbi:MULTISPECIES: hypothetical protein [Comamonas]|uniref:hypothetical protein n=1 Tax=Comamonas TaxID=283 RepID=UPI0005593752|nr:MULTISPECIES: hypothetical protein [Comamonas]WKL14273.1 hypothetical protein QYQ99_17855 [Comamonas testosteroni]